MLPWVHLEVMPQGISKICCVAQEAVREKHVPLNIAARSLEDIRRSPYMRSVRSALASGRRIPACTHCWNEEKRGEHSLRQTWNERHAETVATLATQVEQGRDPAEPLALEYLQLSMGNKCNLACRMCNAIYSSRIAEDPVHSQWASKGDETRMLPAPGSRPEAPALRPGWDPGLPWFEQQRFLHDDLLAGSGSLKLLTVTGGEPLMSDTFQELLDQYVDRGQAPGIVIRLSSNLFHNEARIHRLMERLLRFRHCSVGASVDGYGAVYEYVRYPGRWDIVARNMRIVKSYSQQSYSVTFTLDTVVQPYNCLSLVELLRFADELGVECFFHVIEHPWFLQMHIVPRGLRKLAAERLRVYAGEGAATTGPQAKNRETALRVAKHFELIEDEPGTAQARQHFAAFTQALDVSRKQQLAVSVPELATELAAELAAAQAPTADRPAPQPSAAAPRLPLWSRLARRAR